MDRRILESCSGRIAETLAGAGLVGSLTEPQVGLDGFATYRWQGDGSHPHLALLLFALLRVDVAVTTTPDGLAVTLPGDLALRLPEGSALPEPSPAPRPRPKPQAPSPADCPPTDPLEWWRALDLTGPDREDVRLIVRQIGAAIEAGDVPAVRSLAGLAASVVRPVACANPAADQVEALARFAYGLTGRPREFEVAFRQFRAGFSDRGSYNAGLAAYARGRAAGDAHPATAGSTGLADGLRWLGEAAATLKGREWTYYDWRRVRRLRAWIAQAQGQAVPVVYVGGDR